jgi:hypothetical protein
VVANRVLGLHNTADGYLVEDPTEVKRMFGLHFQNSFPPYALTDRMMASRDTSCQVVPCKVSSGDQDRLDRDFFEREVFCSSYFYAKWQDPGHGWPSL